MAVAAGDSPVVQLLRGSSLFATLSDDLLKEVAARVSPVSFPAGAAVLHEGDPSEDAYVIQRGKAAVGTNNLIGQQVILAVLGPGETFGEAGVITGSPRTATI